MAVAVSISIDTEEDDWGRYVFEGASTRNIAHLPELQDLFGEFGARPTYLVNHPPLLDPSSIEVLGRLARIEGVEIGAHCHPWNTPPYTGEGASRSMMFRLDTESNRAMVGEIRRRIEAELGVRPTTFRAGRWGWGRTVAEALADEGFRVDSSVTPHIDWSPLGGPDFTDAPSDAYRFHPNRPYHPDPDGPLVELPTTVGFLRGSDARLGPLRARLERGVAHGFGLIGALDRLGIMARRWLSPEVSSGREMIRLAENLVAHGRRRLDVTFHSCTLLPKATPFVQDEGDRRRFLHEIRSFLRFAVESGFRFRTLGDLGSETRTGTRAGGP